MEGIYIGRHKVCGGRIIERHRLRGKFNTRSFHWICDKCGKEPDSRDIEPSRRIVEPCMTQDEHPYF